VMIASAIYYLPLNFHLLVVAILWGVEMLEPTTLALLVARVHASSDFPIHKKIAGKGCSSVNNDESSS